MIVSCSILFRIRNVSDGSSREGKNDFFCPLNFLFSKILPSVI